jgi:Urease accessory protein UreF
MKANITNLIGYLQFSDSTFPVGAFSFSNGLESAVGEMLVHDYETLKSYVKSIALQAAFSDGIASLFSYRSIMMSDYDGSITADHYLYRFKMNEEARLMLKKMGKKMTELCIRIFDYEKLKRWLVDINANLTPGTFPVTQGIVFALAGLSEQELFASQQYGVMNMVLSAALRCMKISHFDTQKMLYELNSESEVLYKQVSVMALEEINSFVPEIDILASIHEKGKMRLFMN